MAKRDIHPAQFSDGLLEPLGDALLSAGFPVDGKLLDPFAGLGWKLQWIAERANTNYVVGYEIEPGYFHVGRTAPWVQMVDSRRMPAADNFFDGAVTSSAYPNGISDDFHSSPEDTSTRHTYVHRLRLHLGADYELHPGNAGKMNPRRSPKALEAFYDIHRAVWAETFRVLKPGAPFVVNTKDPLKIPFRMHTEEQLVEAGFELVDSTSVKCHGLNEGSNSELKMTVEDITIARKPW